MNHDARDHAETESAPTNGAATFDLSARLEQLSVRLREQAPREQDVAGRLVALVPCEPVIGPVAVAVWHMPSERPHYRVVRFDGTTVSEAKALRESLILVAMNESLEEQLDPRAVRELMDLLIEWQAAAEGGAGTGATSPGADADAGGADDTGSREDAAVDPPTPAASSGDERELRAAVEQLIWPAVQQLQLIERAVGDPDEVRMARAPRLDELGGLLRELEQVWERLESAAGPWADAAHEAHGDLVQQLWMALSAARRGPLAAPASSVIEAGRAAGSALADEVLATQRG